MDCGKPTAAKGFCDGHYNQQRLGKPLTPLRGTALTPEQRFWANVNQTDGCWIWTASTTSAGYGQMSVRSKMKYAHRVSYELLVGPIPEGSEIDHICFVRKCVNPKHLRLATRKQNSENLRGALSNNMSSGIRNVYWTRSCKKWSVQVSHNGKLYSGGRFTDMADAEAAAIALRNRLFTHNQEELMIAP